MTQDAGRRESRNGRRGEWESGRKNDARRKTQDARKKAVRQNTSVPALVFGPPSRGGGGGVLRLETLRSADSEKKSTTQG